RPDDIWLGSARLVKAKLYRKNHNLYHSYGQNIAFIRVAWSTYYHMGGNYN
ncbi:hypothetical protein TorRG33x02_216900, partial [Trema orientale]